MHKIDREALRNRVTTYLHVEDEETPLEEALDDVTTVERIRTQLRSGNHWAWAFVTVGAVFGPLSAEAFLGQCSYASEGDFKKSEDYELLVREVVDEIAAILENMVNDHDLWEHDRVVCLPCASA